MTQGRRNVAHVDAPAPAPLCSASSLPGSWSSCLTELHHDTFSCLHHGILACLLLVSTFLLYSLRSNPCRRSKVGCKLRSALTILCLFRPHVAACGLNALVRLTVLLQTVRAAHAERGKGLRMTEIVGGSNDGLKRRKQAKLGVRELTSMKEACRSAQGGKACTAVAWLKQHIDQHPNAVDALNNLGVIYSSVREGALWMKAQHFFERALAVDASSPAVLYNYALLHGMMPHNHPHNIKCKARQLLASVRRLMPTSIHVKRNEVRWVDAGSTFNPREWDQEDEQGRLKVLKQGGLVLLVMTRQRICSRGRASTDVSHSIFLADGLG